MLPTREGMWDISDMATVDELRGRRLYDALIAIKPPQIAETDWAVNSGLNRGFFSNLKASEDASPRLSSIRKLLSVIGKSEADLDPGAPEAPRAGKRTAHDVTIDQAPDILPTAAASEGETVEILQLDLSLPMGPGATVDDYIEETPYTFDLAYVRSFTRTPPARLRLARGVGDSMLPTLNSNDLVWIDSTQTHLNQQDRVWAVSINGAAAIKRLRALKGGRVMVVSDNPSIGDYDVDADEIMIGGRVIRFARDI